MLLDLFAGRKSVAVTFWLGFVTFGLILTGVLVLLRVLFFSATESTQAERIIIADISVRAFLVIYLVFLLRAVYRASSWQRRPNVWSWFAMGAVALGILVQGWLLLPYVSSNMPASEAEVRADVFWLNRSLPQQLDNETQMLSVGLQGRDLVYEMSANVELSEDEIVGLQKKFENDLHNNHVLCRDMTSYFNGPVDNIVYTYVLRNLKHFEVRISKEECNDLLLGQN